VDVCSELNIEGHQLALHRRRCGGLGFAACRGCNEILSHGMLNQHEPNCCSQTIAEDAADRENVTASRSKMPAELLSKAQLSALQFVITKAVALSDAAHGVLVRRLAKLGYDEHHLRAVLRFIRNHAPCIVHVNLTLRPQLLSDTHYRSQFETGVSCGNLSPTSRSICEEAMFGRDAYSSSCAAFDRCKVRLTTCLLRARWYRH
jgi:hypothetical protein